MIYIIGKTSIVLPAGFCFFYYFHQPVGADPENSERGGRVPRPNEKFTFQDMQQ